ncbi:uncharacterized protein LOC129928007 [Biomphalaria glabrata]|uniref:Uncharacterized protein LOC129928007 n=1 Tax=Biomphalaria glabrata TaxID=6526 RepID=A0A9W3B8J0_BIOGL|nr:uncharacterized protein LOC129928007 [Biomphalaria glabrata]
MTRQEIVLAASLWLLIVILVTDARSVQKSQLQRNVATPICPTPTAPPNGVVSCEYSDPLQIQIFCTITCKAGYMFRGTDAMDFVFPCDVSTGFYDTVTSPDCIPVPRSTLVPPLG